MAVQVKTTDQLREHWNRMAEHFSRTSAKLSGKIYQSILPYLRLNEVEVVVETACGDGRGIELMLQQLPSTGKVLASDISSVFLDMVRAKNLERVELVEASNEALPYGDAVADRYVSSMSLHLVESPERMAAEAFRVLKPGGIAAFSVWGDRDKATLFDLMMCMREKYATHHTRSPFHLSDISTLKSLLRSAGFTRVITFDDFAYMPILDLDTILTSFANHPDFKPIYDELDDEKKERFREDMRCYLHTVLKVRQQPLAIQGRIAIAFKP